MKRWLMVLLFGMGLAACNNDDNQTNTSVNSPELAPSLAEGTYQVSVETSDELPLAGRYYSGADGNKFLVLYDANERAKIVMQYDAKTKKWQSNLNDNSKALIFAHQEQVFASQIGLEQLVGSYTLSLSNGSTVPVEINAQGQLSSKDQNCAFTGAITANQVAQTMSYELTVNSCEAMKNNMKGFVVVDDNSAPASFRLLSASVGSQDILAFEGV
jgi:hypothetical protein